MFNFYVQFTAALFNIPPDSAIYGNFTGNQFAVWSVMQSNGRDFIPLGSSMQINSMCCINYVFGTQSH